MSRLANYEGAEKPPSKATPPPTAYQIYEVYFTPVNSTDREIFGIQAELYPQQQLILDIIKSFVSQPHDYERMSQQLTGHNILKYLSERNVFPHGLTRAMVDSVVLGRVHEILSDTRWLKNRVNAAIEAYKTAINEYENRELDISYYRNRVAGFYHLPQPPDTAHTLMVEKTPSDASLSEVVFSLINLAHEIGHYLDMQRLPQLSEFNKLTWLQQMRTTEYNQQYLTLTMYVEVIQLIESLPSLPDLQRLKRSLEYGVNLIGGILSNANGKFNVRWQSDQKQSELVR